MSLLSRWVTRAGVAVAAACLCAGVVVPAHAADDGLADPALQQVVSDDEPIDRDSHVVFDHGHCDIGPKLIDGTWELLARDDSVTPSVWRPIDNMVFKLSDAAIMPIPEGTDYAFTGAKAGEKVYVIPQSEIASVPWLGWSTQSPAVNEAVDGQVQLVFEGHEGPGQFTNFMQAGNFGGPQQNWTSATAQAQVLNVDLNTHAHSNWVFTAPGVHLVRVTAKAKTRDGKDVSATATLRFAVGDATSTDEAAQATWKGADHAQAHPADDPQVTGDTPESSLRVLLGVAIGVAVVGALALVAAVILLRSSKRRREVGLAQARAAQSSPEREDV